MREIRKILVLRNDRFGEFLLNIPALRALKETFKNAKLMLVAGPGAKELAEVVPYVNEIIEWRNDGHTLKEKLKLIGFLKRQNIDMAVMLNPSKDFNIFTFLAGMPIRVGYNRKWGFLLTHKMKDLKHAGNEHEVDYNLKLVGLIGAASRDKSISLDLNKADAEQIVRRKGLASFHNMLAVHPFTSDSVKQWPFENFRELARRLTDELGVKAIIIGGRQESAIPSQDYAVPGENIINLVGKTTLIELAAILKNCRLLISGDSGPVHLASAVGTPVIALFRNDLPGKTAKRWGPWGEGHFVIEKANLNDITVDEVFGCAKELLNK
jgi:heptosyltransferase II